MPLILLAAARYIRISAIVFLFNQNTILNISKIIVQQARTRQSVSLFLNVEFLR
jgi:hypothetical protein